jgi:hypothetical protein
MCNCWGSFIQLQDPPLLFNIAKDPGETMPLDTQTPKHQEILKLIEHAIVEHEKSIEPVVSQYSPLRLVPLPWLQPCCNFPRCMCRDSHWSKQL